MEATETGVRSMLCQTNRYAQTMQTQACKYPDVIKSVLDVFFIYS